MTIYFCLLGLKVPNDLFVLLGSSNPDADQKFAAQKSLLKSLIEKLDISDRSTLVSFVSYNKPPVFNTRIGEDTNRDETLRTLNRIINYQQSSHIAAALQSVNNSIFSRSSVAKRPVAKRPSVAKIPSVATSVMMFVDKRDVDDKRVINQVAKHFKDNGIKLVIIAIGGDVDGDYLKTLASDENSVFFPPNLDELKMSSVAIDKAIQPGN